MTNSDWLLLAEEVEEAKQSFTFAVRFFSTRNPSEDDPLEKFATQAKFCYAMLTGHTSLEKAIERCLKIAGEDRPSGTSWHRDILILAAKETPNRPAILDEETFELADETRSFRNVAQRNYSNFKLSRAAPAARAAGELAKRIEGNFLKFKNAIDPDSGTTLSDVGHSK